MNGWQRLFTVMWFVIVTPTFALWLMSAPREDGMRTAYACQSPRYVTPKEASEALASGAYQIPEYGSIPDCVAALREVADGTAYKDEKAAWIKNFYFGAATLFVAFGIIYALGWAFGWVWRGFFPKKT